MRGRKGRRVAPERIIRWGEKGVKGIRYTGEMPRDFRGQYTGQFYVYNDRRPLLGIDVRDLPGLTKDAGKENLQLRRDDGTYSPVNDLKETAPPVTAKAVPKSRKQKLPPKPVEEKDEVNDVD